MTAFVLLAVMTVALAAVSFVPGADRLYSSPLFVAGWGVVAVAAVGVMARHKLWRRPALLLLHGALLVILAGAFITNVWGSSLTLHLRQGETDFVGRVPVTLEEVHTSADAMECRLTVGGRELPVALNRVAMCGGMSFVQTGHDADGRGVSLSVTRDPVGVAVTFAGYALLLLAIPFTLWRRRNARIAALAVMAVAGTLLLAYGDAIGRWWVALRGMAPVPVLRSPLLAVHVSCVASAYLLLALTACLGVASAFGRRRQPVALARRLLRPAVCLLAAGIFLGAVWANVSWGRYWGWDPKEVWALITMLVYCAPLHERLLPVFRSDRVYAIYSTAAFATVLITYFGVNHLLGGLHSYV